MEKIDGIPEISALTLKKCSAQEITSVFGKYYVESVSGVIICRMREMKTK